jgi:hypothetical protein
MQYFFRAVLRPGAPHEGGAPGVLNGQLQTLPLQMLLMQSVPTLQLLPDGHAGHVPPPQSTSVSFPFLTRSVQVGAWHVPPMQTPLTQSEVTLQP